MGGANSGRWAYHVPKQTVESCRRIAIGDFDNRGTKLWKDGARLSYRVLKDRQGIVFAFQASSTADEHMFSVAIEKTAPQFGGERLWFNCPMCGKRSVKLYKPIDQQIFACRICSNLTYESSQMSKSVFGNWSKMLYF